MGIQWNQPMVSSCGKYTTVFNGEIYNYLLNRQLSYKFITNSDVRSC